MRKLDDNSQNVYYKDLRIVAGSVTATILLSKFLYYWYKNNCKPFYKFIMPSPMNEKYKEGESWSEELCFSYKEFRTAYKRLENVGVVSKKINSNRVTHYTVYVEKLHQLLHEAKSEMENQNEQ